MAGPDPSQSDLAAAGPDVTNEPSLKFGTAGSLMRQS